MVELEKYLNRKNQVTMEQKTETKAPTPVQEKVNKAIAESTDLIAALEAVGAMYGIPATNIIADDTAHSIVVKDDMIIAPPVSAQGQNKPIIQAVGTVLDYISQRIDDKLNAYQTENIETGNTPEDNGTPSDTEPGSSYFTDEDDISADIDMNASANVSAGDMTGNEIDIAKAIGESAYHVNMIAKLGDTTHLGYDLLNRHGFDFVKPIDSIVQEAASEKKEDEEKPAKKGKKIKVEDIKHMKFDNKGILEAIKYLNAARDEQDNIKDGKKIDLKSFVNSSNYHKAIQALNKQFNCSMNIKFIESKRYGSNVMTEVINNVGHNITVSKSKGFQLNNMPVNIFVLNHFLDCDEAINGSDMFGQTFISIILHELFHNIYHGIAKDSMRMGMSLTMTLALASAADTMKEKRIILTNYVDSLEELKKGKFMNKLAKRGLIRRLMALTTVSDNEGAIHDMKKAAESGKNSDEYIDNLIKKYKKANRYVKPSKLRHIIPLVGAAMAIFGGIYLGIGMEVMSGITGLFALSLTGGLLNDVMQEESLKAYDAERDYEEFWCDMFAGMYNLPVKFFIGSSAKKYVPNDFSAEKLNELAQVSREFSRSIKSSYPTVLERNHAAVTVAKNILEDKDIDPAIKKYCKWVVDNFDAVTHTEINTIYNAHTFDPKTAEDLDKHMQDLITDNNIVTTESYKIWTNKE